MGHLTKQQQELVENNHNLIYGFAKSRKLNIEEYYDLLAIGLCISAKSYDESKGKFSTYAYRVMDNEFYKHLKHVNRQSNIPDKMIMSYDSVCINNYSNDSENGKKLDNLYYLKDERYTNDIVVGNMMSEVLINMLNGKEKTIAKYLFIGLKHAEIAEIMNCSRQNITTAVQKIRNKWQSYLKYSYN